MRMRRYREMFKKMLETLEKANFRAKLKNGGLRCPDCAAPAGDIPANWNDLMSCKSCGTRTSMSEWARSPDAEYRVGFADKPPVGTKIRRETNGDNQVIWHIPAVGKFGFFFFFAVLWLCITGLVSGGFLFTYITGGKIEGDGPKWLMIPFFGLFWAVGLGTLYAAFRQKYLRHTVTFGGDRVTLRKDMFGRTSEKSLAKSSVSSVSQKEFYQQNYKPVYGIEIRGSDGKLRFGSALSEEDKAWLVADFNQVLAGGKKSESGPKAADATRGLAPIKLEVPKSVFSIPIPKPSASSVVGSLIFAVIGIAFVYIGIFVIEGDSIPKEQQGKHGAFEWFFFLMADGFRTVWTLFSSMFAVIGFVMAYSTFRAMGKDRRIEGTEEEVSIRTYRKGLILESRSFPRNTVHDIRGFHSGSSSGKTMKRVELIVGNKSEKIANWMDGDMADRLIEKVRAALGKS